MWIVKGFGFGSNFLPKIWPSHRLAVALASERRATSLRRSNPNAIKTI